MFNQHSTLRYIAVSVYIFVVSLKKKSFLSSDLVMFNIESFLKFPPIVQSGSILFRNWMCGGLRDCAFSPLIGWSAHVSSNDLMLLQKMTERKKSRQLCVRPVSTIVTKSHEKKLYSFHLAYSIMLVSSD